MDRNILSAMVWNRKLLTSVLSGNNPSADSHGQWDLASTATRIDRNVVVKEGADGPPLFLVQDIRGPPRSFFLDHEERFVEFRKSVVDVLFLRQPLIGGFFDRHDDGSPTTVRMCSILSAHLCEGCGVGS